MTLPELPGDYLILHKDWRPVVWHLEHDGCWIDHNGQEWVDPDGTSTFIPLTAIAQAREALAVALGYVTLQGYEGRSEASMAEDYPEAVAETQAKREKVKKALQALGGAP